MGFAALNPSYGASRDEPGMPGRNQNEVFRMKAFDKYALLPVMVCFLALQGCVSDVNLTRPDLDKVRTMVIGHAPTPPVEVKTVGGMIFLGSLLSRGIDNQASKNFQARAGANPVDFGELLTRKFADKARSGIAGWPRTKILGTPVANDQEIKGPSAIFTFGKIMLTANDYFYAEAFLVVKDDSGRVICNKFRNFSPYLAKRAKHSRDEFVADNGKVLRQEMEYAAEYLASEFVNALNASLAVPQGT